MSFFKNLFGKNLKESFEEENEVSERDYLFYSGKMTNDTYRTGYEDNCIARMKDASDEIDTLNREYDAVTSLLNDMDEIERLPEGIAMPIRNCANRILRLEKESLALTTIDKHMSEDDFNLMERFEDELPEAIDKLKDAEDYQKKIKSDLSRLEGEKQAYHYRKNELGSLLENLKGFFMICIIGTVTATALLIILKFMFEMEIKTAFFVAAALVALMFTIVFVKITDIKRESSKLNKTLGKLIQMHNTVKIRYVNNTNLLDYLYMKYEVDSSRELRGLYESYLAEKEERERLKQTKNDIAFYMEELVERLKDLQLSDPGVWKHQLEALVDRKEAVEIRHGLISRRQALRKQIELNSDYAKDAEDDLKELVRRFPQYSVEVMKRLEAFENKERF